MNIQLYYCEGISQTDTPSFLTREEQQTYFNNRLFKEIETSYYPPYFNNTISLDSESDLTYTSKVNYLSLYLDGKYYYYFITNIRYENSGIILLDIEMDSIQTYMFDIDASDILIERFTIPRYYIDGTNTYLINRNYLRENVSRGNFIQRFKKLYNELPTGFMGYICVWNVTDWNNAETPYINYIVTNNPDNYTNTFSCRLYFLPIEKDSSAFLNKQWFLSSEDTEDNRISYPLGVDNLGNLSAFIQWFAKDPSTLRMAFVNADFMESNSLRYSNNTIIYNPDYVNLRPHKITTSKGDITFACLEVKANMIHWLRMRNLDDYTFDFKPNLLSTTTFDISYCPYLLDENYIHFVYGDLNVLCSYPLYLLETNTLYLGLMADFQGNRYYYINTETNLGDYFYAPYNNLVCDTLQNNYELINDTWANWKAQNTITFAAAAARSAMNIASCFVPSGKTTTTATTLIKNTQTRKRYYKNKKKYIPSSQQVNTRKTDKAGSSEHYSQVTPNDFLPILDVAVDATNAYFAPDTLKSDGEILSQTITQSTRHALTIEVVDDIEACALYFEQYGCLVNKYYLKPLSNGSIFTFFNNRKRFNYIQLTSADIHLNNAIESQEICDDIEQRFINGLRLWLDYDNINNYEIDNNEDYVNYPKWKDKWIKEE